MDHSISSQDFTYTITSANDTWTMDKGVSINTDAQLGISMLIAASDSHLVVDGHVTTTDNANTALKFSALVSNGDHTRIDIGKTGELTGEMGVLLGGAHQLVHNDGKITGSNDLGMLIQSDDVSLTNQGTISSAKTFALQVNDTGNHIVNGAHGMITGAAGVHFVASAGETNTLVNHGTIQATGGFEVAILGDSDVGSNSVEDIRNNGRIEGNVMLGAGDDEFDDRGGTVTGVVLGGEGNDTYIVGKQHYRIGESDNGGFDSVFAYSSYKVAAGQSIEQSSLAGKGDLDLTGNGKAETLYGNDGKNHISGGGGGDFIFTGKGADIMTGNGGADHFFFSTGDGHDKISDFHDGQDVLELGLLKGVTDFDDLKQHYTTESKGDLIIHVGDDQLTIHDMDKQDFDVKDVSFQIYL